jgi:RNase P/RNase MRP subunit p29
MCESGISVGAYGQKLQDTTNKLKITSSMRGLGVKLKGTFFYLRSKTDGQRLAPGQPKLLAIGLQGARMGSRMERRGREAQVSPHQ